MLQEKTESKESKKILDRSVLWPFILLTCLFFAWGVPNNLTDMLLSAFKRILSMSDSQTGLVQSAFYGAYFCFALPAAFFIQRFSYKSAILLGLGMFVTGALLFYPASQTMVYLHFLIALYVLAGGLAFLETAANPYIVELGSEETGTRRLNLAQSFNPIGALTGVVIGDVFILSKLNQADADQRAAMPSDQLMEVQSQELAAVMEPYIGIAAFILVLWLLIAFTKMPKARGNDEKPQSGVFKRLIKRPKYVKSVIAQFCCVAAQIGIWSFLIRYVTEELGGTEAEAGNYQIASLVVFIIGRFVSTYLMGFIHPGKLLSIMASSAIILTLFAAIVGGQWGTYALVMVSACFSLNFPTIFGLGVEGLGKDTKFGGAGLIMAILGGAIMPPIQGLISDATNINTSFIIPILCWTFIVYFGFSTLRRTKVS